MSEELDKVQDGVIVLASVGEVSTQVSEVALFGAVVSTSMVDEQPDVEVLPALSMLVILKL